MSVKLNIMKGDKKMKVTFENVLVCDVDCYTFDDKQYYGVIVYQEGKLYRISIPTDKRVEFTQQIGKKVTLTAVMKVYNGKTKFKLVF